jgi:hypothetical protein
VVVHVRSTGDAPILKQSKFKVRVVRFPPAIPSTVARGSIILLVPAISRVYSGCTRQGRVWLSDLAYAMRIPNW